MNYPRERQSAAVEINPMRLSFVDFLLGVTGSQWSESQQPILLGDIGYWVLEVRFDTTVTFRK